MRVLRPFMVCGQMAEKEMWDAGEVERPDTDILYYDLAGLRLTEYLWDDESPEHSLYAIRDGKRYLELNGGDLTKAEIFFC